MTRDVIERAIAEACRRQAISDRDVSGSVEHFAQSVRTVCDVWGLTAERWLEGGAGTPTLAVTRSDGTTGVLKIAEPGDLNAAARVMEAADGRGYARVLAWDADRGALPTERLKGRVVGRGPDVGPAGAARRLPPTRRMARAARPRKTL